jgi:TonB family protein
VADAELQALTDQLAFETSSRNDQDLQDILALSPTPQASQALYSMGAPVSISSLTRTTYVAPKYPRSAERRSLSGWVDLVFTVDTDGTTKDIEVSNSEPGQTFDRAAKKAIEKWKFMPVFENGIVVEKRAGVRMMFALE